MRVKYLDRDGRAAGNRGRRPAGDLPAARDRPSERRAVHRPHLEAEARHGGEEVQEARQGQAAARAWLATDGEMPLRVIFMGTPEFSVPTLRAVAAAGHEIAAAYTQPPRPAGRRGLELTPSPVQREAERLGVEVRIADLAEGRSGTGGVPRVECRRGGCRRLRPAPAQGHSRRHAARLLTTAMPRFCRAGGVRHPSSGRSWRATGKPA